MADDVRRGEICTDPWASSFTDSHARRMGVDEFCRRMPKIELHAHLSGSVPDSVVQQLLEAASGGVEPSSSGPVGEEESSEEVILIKTSNDSSSPSSSHHGKKTSGSSAVGPPQPDDEGGRSLEFESQFTIAKKGKRRTMEECFSVFRALHRAIDSLAALATATRAVLDAFHKENVVYLELRSTPRAFACSSKRDYMDTLVQTVTEWQEEQRQFAMVVRLVVSLDRGRPLSDAEENLQVALQMAKEQEKSGGDGLLVGVDVSGDPSKSDLRDLLPLMQRAKEGGLGVLLHACEVLNDRCHSECLAVLRQVAVDRLGHGTYLHCDQLENYYTATNDNTATLAGEKSGDGDEGCRYRQTEGCGGASTLDTAMKLEDDERRSDDIRALQQLVRQQKIPIEACLSSNLCSGTCPAAEQHHFKRWFLEAGHPVCVCTDDRGVFQTTLSAEFAALAEAFTLEPSQLQLLVEHAASASLLPRQLKERLLERVRAEFSSLLRGSEGNPCQQ